MVVRLNLEQQSVENRLFYTKDKNSGRSMKMVMVRCYGDETNSRLFTARLILKHSVIDSSPLPISHARGQQSLKPSKEGSERN